MVSAVCVCVSYCREHMASYTIPTGLVLVEEMPRNQMGKVNKKDLVRLFFPWLDRIDMYDGTQVPGSRSAGVVSWLLLTLDKHHRQVYRVQKYTK